MSRTTKRFLSILLAAAMILSLGITGWAVDDEIVIDEPESRPAVETGKHVTDAFEGGTELELEEIDPGTLNVPKLGEIEDEENTMQSEELPYALDELVRVSIVLEEPSTLAAGFATQNIAENRSAMNYRHALRQQQAGVEAAIAAAGVPMNVKWNMTLAINAISAEVPYGDIETIKDIAGVRDVFLENRYEPQVDEINTANTTEYMVGATAVWANGYTGAGSRVAIIDTGTDQDHQSFDPEALEYALEQDGLTPDLLTWDEISAVASELNANTHRGSGLTEEVYKNTKIPFAYNYVDGGFITDHLSDGQGEHGSHVSGIAAANRYVKIDGEFVDSASNLFAVGVAPDAQILTMKVFGAGGGAYDSDYMVAIEDAIILKADSVNLSLGSGNPGYTFAGEYQEIMDSLVNCGTVVSMSAGNSYNWANSIPNEWPYLYSEDVSLHTGGSPGSFANSLGVASAENTGTVAAPLFFNGDQMVLFTETTGYGNVPFNTVPGTYDYVLVNGPGVDDNDHIGQEGDAFAAIGSEVLSGKIALCYRGSSSFFAKANAAAAQGAAGVIIINNTSGVIRMNLTGYEYTVPVASILKADGDSIRTSSTPVQNDEGKVIYYTGKVEVTAETKPIITTERADAVMSDFSSWGVPGSLIMKPEITAPGGNIYSVFGSNYDSETGAVNGGPDQYEFMSGTSMAAPHITGMAALLGQYIRENKLDELTGLNARTLINSLLMSTATPMIVDGYYLPVMQQGAGLGDTFAATQAKAYIMMGEDATASWEDGKVKAELGQDAAREGVYSYSFTVNNFSNQDVSYDLATDMFTQNILIAEMYKPYGIDLGSDRMDTGTVAFSEGEDYTVSYAYEQLAPNPHDVNKDGVTDVYDAQAILDYLTGAVDGEDLDLEVGEMDGVEGISSYDAQLLLTWEAEDGTGNLLVPARGKVTVTVTITYSDDLKAFLDYYFTGGAWVEGYTYLTPDTTTEDGEMLDVEYSIPILGFYGSFTDASMFDCTSAIESAYGSVKQSYTGNGKTNFMTVNYGKGSTVYMGNPYVVEEEFPADRLAVNGNTKLVNLKYNMIRNAASAGWMAIDLSNYDILKSSIGGQELGAWYYVNGGSWQNTATQSENINTTAMKLGLREDDTFRIGYFAIPEYYGIMLHPGENISSVTDEEIVQLMKDGELGAGAMMGFDLTVDNTAPTAEAKLSDDGSKITVTAKDNNYIATIAIMDVGGNVVYDQQVPEQTEKGEEVEVTFDVSGLDLPNGVAIFIGDYAANEKAYLIIFDPDKPVTSTKVVYMLTDTLEDGGEYIIATSNAAGGANALMSQGANYYTTATRVEILTDDLGTYIPADTADASFVWNVGASATEGAFNFFNASDGGALGYNQPDYPYVSWGNASYADDFVYLNNCLLFAQATSYGMSFSGSSFVFSTSPTEVFLYEKETLEIELDVHNASSVTVTPEAATLILDVIPTVELMATVEPIVLPDLTVTWTSSDETVATVDENGVVTAVGNGTAIITASSNQTPEVTGSAVINVTAGEPMNAVVYGQVARGDEIEYAQIDLSSMNTTDLSDHAMFSAFYGGCVSGEYVYGNDVDNDFHRYKWTDSFAYDSDYHFVISATWALWDGACFPAFAIADYADVDTTDESTDNDEPTVTTYPYILTGFNSSSKLAYFTADGKLTYFNLEELGNFVAATFVGAQLNQNTGLPNLYYLLLADDGSLYLWVVYPDLESGGMNADYNLLAHVNVLTFGEDKAAYSMSYYEDENDEDLYGVLIADSSLGGIYFVNLSEISGGEVDAHFVGKIDGATSLTTLSDLYWDTLTSLGTISVNKPEESGGDDGNSLSNFRLPAFAANATLSGNTLYSVDASLYETEDADDIAIDSAEDDDIVIVGGLDSIRRQLPGRRVERLDAAVLVNPDYASDDHVEIAITAPDDVTEVTNGFATLEYDPTALTFVSLTPNEGLEITSYTVDDNAGLIKFAYASSEPVEAGTVATVIFSTPTKDTFITATTLEVNDNVDVDEVTQIRLGDGFIITIEDYTAGNASYTVINDKDLFKGEITFTISSADDRAVLVVVKTTGEDDETFEIIPCETEDDVHSFTITVDKDITIALAFKGDANLNGTLEAMDGTMIKRAALQTYTLDSVLKVLVSDINQDGTIQAMEGTKVSRAALGTYTLPW